MMPISLSSDFFFFRAGAPKGQQPLFSPSLPLLPHHRRVFEVRGDAESIFGWKGKCVGEV